jgi:hypothetical protein
MADTLNILRAGMTTVQDLGRFGRSRYGLPVNGALDQHSARVANVLCGNDEGAPLLEITALDFSCTPSTDVLVAVTGAPADLTVDGVVRPQWEPLSVRSGETIRISGIRTGIRVYLAVLARSTPRPSRAAAPPTRSSASAARCGTGTSSACSGTARPSTTRSTASRCSGCGHRYPACRRPGRST